MSGVSEEQLRPATKQERKALASFVSSPSVGMRLERNTINGLYISVAVYTAHGWQVR